MNFDIEADIIELQKFNTIRHVYFPYNKTLILVYYNKRYYV